MSDKKTIKEDINTNAIRLFPVRIIPVDVGFKVSSSYRKKIVSVLGNFEYEIEYDTRLFGENALLKVLISEGLCFYLFNDGVGTFVLEEPYIEYSSIDKLNADEVLVERKKAHADILQHSHKHTKEIDSIVYALRNIVPQKKRRFTSSNEWESGGLSYVMSFYFLDADKNIIEQNCVKEWLGNMLFTDRHNYFGTLTEVFKNENQEQMMTNVDVLDDVHACLSWANFIILGRLPLEQRNYYISLETVLQHIWMYSYITEQNIDLFLAKSNKSVSSKQLTEFYDTLIDMTLIVKKYDTIISSTVHERELRIFEALKESSKLEVLKKGIEDKSNILESKLSWAIEHKQLISDRNTELFIIALTLLQVISGFGISFGDMSDPKVWLIVLISMIVLIIYRMRD